MNILLLILGYRGTINMLYDRQSKRADVQLAYENYRTLNINTNKQKLEEFIKEFNLLTKTEYHISKINHTIAKLKKRLSKLHSHKRITKYEVKIERVKLKKTNEYILDNIEYLKIKCPIVHLSDFNDLDNDNNDNNLKTRPDFNKQVNKKSAKGAINLILYTAFFGMLAVSFSNDLTASFWFGLLGTLFTQLIRIFNATMDLPNIYDNAITSTYFARKNILEKYIIWNKQNPDLIYQNILDKEKDKIKVELKNEVLTEAKEMAKLELKEELKKNGIAVN